MAPSLTSSWGPRSTRISSPKELTYLSLNVSEAGMAWQCCSTSVPGDRTCPPSHSSSHGRGQPGHSPPKLCHGIRTLGLQRVPQPSVASYFYWNSVQNVQANVMECLKGCIFMCIHVYSVLILLIHYYFLFHACTKIKLMISVQLNVAEINKFKHSLVAA